MTWNTIGLPFHVQQHGYKSTKVFFPANREAYPWSSGFDLSFWSVVVKIYPCTALYCVNTHENMNRNKFSQPIGQYISHGHWKQIYCLKRQFLRSDRYLFAQIQHNINSTIKCEICSKLTKEAPDVVLVSLLLTLNLFGMLS